MNEQTPTPDNQDDQSTAIARLDEVKHLLTSADKDLDQGRERDASRKNIRATRHLADLVRDLVSGAAG